VEAALLAERAAFDIDPGQAEHEGGDGFGGRRGRRGSLAEEGTAARELGAAGAVREEAEVDDEFGSALAFGDFNADGFNNDRLQTPSFGYDIDASKQNLLGSGVFTQSDFVKPPLGQNGTLARNAFIGPGFNSTDLNIARKFRAPFLGEAGRVDFRVEFFNLFNRTNLQGPSSEIRSSTFGKSTSAFGARNIQFGLKIVF